MLSTVKLFYSATIPYSNLRPQISVQTPIYFPYYDHTVEEHDHTVEERNAVCIWSHWPINARRSLSVCLELLNNYNGFVS